jgi:hypothetical protein
MTNRRNWLFAVIALTGGFLGGAVATQFGPGIAMAARHTHSVTAEEFVLVDKAGTQRAVMEVTSRGLADLAMYDGNGQDRAEFRVAKDGSAAIGFYDQNGARRILIGEVPGGRNGISIYGGNNRQLASLTVAEDNQASLTLYDPTNGRARAGLGVSAKGLPALVLFDENGKDRAEIHVTANGKPGLALADESGKSIAGLPEQAAAAQPQQQ